MIVTVVSLKEIWKKKTFETFRDSEKTKMDILVAAYPSYHKAEKSPDL